MYWENLQQIQEGATSAADYKYLAYAETKTSIAETPLPALKDIWPTQQNVKRSRKSGYQAVTQEPSYGTDNPATAYDPYTQPNTVTTTYTSSSYVYDQVETAPTYVYERTDSQDVEVAYVDGRQVTITTIETDHDDPIRETHITEVEINSPDYIDYSRLGPSARDITIDGKALLEGFSLVLSAMHNNYEALTTNNNNSNTEASTSEVCQLQIDGLPLSQLFQSFLPHLQNGGGQKMIEQYQQLSAQLSQEKCMSFLQTMQQQQQQQQQQYGAAYNYQAAQNQGKGAGKTREEVSAFDLHETAETLINLAKYPVEKKAVVVEMIPQTSGSNPDPQQNFMNQQNVNANVPSDYCATSTMESLPMDHFEFTKEDKDLMDDCVAPLDPREEVNVEKLITETFENVEKTKFISDEVAAAIPDIQRKFLVCFPSGYGVFS